MVCLAGNHASSQQPGKIDLLDDGFGESFKKNIGAAYLLLIHYQFTEPVFDTKLIFANFPKAVLFNSELENWFLPALENDSD